MTPQELEQVAERLVQKSNGYGPWFCTIEQVTRPEMVKKSRISGGTCPYANAHKDGKDRPLVVHIARKQAIIHANYESMVNRQRQREDKTPDFKAQSLWNGAGKHLTKSIVQHTETGQTYLEYRPRHHTEDLYVVLPEDTDLVGWDLYELATRSGSIVQKAEIEEYLRSGGGNARQGLEEEVEVRTVKIENLVGID